MIIIYTAILLLFKLSEIECELKIIKNELPVDMETQAVGLSIDEIKHNLTLDSIALKLTQTYNQLYGPQWVAFTSKESPGSHFESQPKTLLHFSYENIHIILFKPKSIGNVLHQLEAVKTARTGQITELLINATNEIKNGVFNLTKEAVQKEDDFGEIQSYLKQHLSTKLGGVWLTIITVKTEYTSNWDINFRIDSSLEFELGECRFYLYHQK